MKQYLDIIKRILDEGKIKHNRTGIDTLSISGSMIEFDMSTGKFPLLTTKKMGLKNICAELEMFIHGITSKKFLQDRNCHIWDAWCNPKKVPYGTDEETKAKMAAETDLSKIYGYQWNNFEGVKQIITITPRKIQNNTERVYPIFPVTDIDGKEVFTNNAGNQFIVLSTYNQDIDGHTRKLAKIQFLHTGFIKEDVRYDMGVLNGNVKDPYEPSYLNIGYTGNQTYIDTFIARYDMSLYKQVEKIWMHMLDRCYNKECKIYQYYGAKGVFVDIRWHDFSQFVRDIQTLEQWPAFVRNPTGFELDKDYYAANAYSVQTCVWLSNKENALYRDVFFKPFYAINEHTGEKQLFISQVDCAETLNIPRKISLCLNGQRKHTGGYRFEYVNDGKIYRYSLYTNQLKNVIEKLKTDPTDRRMIVSAWNPQQLNEMALPPCHYSFQLLSNDGYVDLLWNQRSSDFPLGVPYDLASYAMLLTLICKQVHMKPGKVIGFFADSHIYVNQIDGIREQLLREPYESPTVSILNADDPNWTIWDWKYTDFELKNYQCHPAIKFPVAV